MYFAQMQWLFVNPSFLPFCQFFETALANLPSHILQVLLCYSVAIAASCKELVNPTIRTTRSTIFDDRREDGKCQLKVETICSFFNLSWYVKSLKVATAEILTNLFKKITQFYSFKYNPHCSKKIQN